MAEHSFDTADMLSYQANTESKINAQIKSLNSQKASLSAQLKAAQQQLASAIAYNSDPANKNKIDTSSIQNQISQIQSDISSIESQISELNTAISETRNFINNLIEIVNNTDGNYSKALKEMNEKIQTYTNKMNGITNNLHQLGLNTNNQDLKNLSLNFSSSLQTNFSEAFNLNEGLVNAVINVFWGNLPPELQEIIDIKDIIATDDGFAMYTKELDTILSQLGYTEIDGLNVKEYYDDWYLYGISDVNLKETVYSILKMRIDGKSMGVSIPFVSFDINDLRSRNENLKDILPSMTNAGQNSVANQILLDYFSNIDSKGSYLIAEAMVDKIITANPNLVFNYSTTGADKIDRIMEYLRNNGSITLDENSKTFHVNKLTQEAKKAILSIYSNNTSYNSFAGEVQFHAAYADRANFILNTPNMTDDPATIWYYTFIYGAGIKADMGIDEEGWLNGILSSQYLNDNSKYVVKQQEAHGKW